jgi:zeaxanthin epoxidase
VFLGNGQYFVSSDVGGGKMQWYGFHKEPANGTDPEGRRKERLLDIFGHWTDDVVDLIKATPEVGCRGGCGRGAWGAAGRGPCMEQGPR